MQPRGKNYVGVEGQGTQFRKFISPISCWIFIYFLVKKLAREIT